MKNFFRFLMAVAVLFTASCAKEDVSSSIAGGEVEVTFSAALPELGTRAGEGNHANVLRYFVFDAATGEKLDALCDETQTIGNGKFSFTLAMLKGMKYNIALWADCDKLYSIDDNGQNVTISYQNANDDSRDAFSAYIESFDPLSDTPSFLLYRPFAQLNALVVDSDIDVVANNEVDLTTSTITVNTYTQFNLFTQDVAGNEQPVTFTATAMPKDTTLKSGYTNLSMNYLLVPKAGMISNVDFVFNGTIAGSPFTFEQTSYKNVPFKQNYRTNILGALLSQSKEFTVEIKPAFNEPAEDVDGDKIVKTNVATIAELQDAIDAATVGRNIILFEQDINAASTRALAGVTIVQKKGVILTIDGCGYKFEGSIKIHSNSDRANNGPVTFTNINFEASEAVDFISALEFTNNQRYSQNITVDNCTFNVPGNVINESVVGIKVNSCQNLIIRNCSATNMHSFLQAQSCDKNILVDNVTITNCKNGISFGNTAYPTITNSTISTNAYGVRGDGDASRGNLVIKNSTITSAKPVVIRRMTTSGYSIALESGTVLNASALYSVVFTQGEDDKTYVAPTVSYSIYGAEGYNVYPMEDGAPFHANNAEQVANAINAGATEVVLSAGTYTVPAAAQGKTLTISGTEDTKIDVSKGLTYVNGANITFEGITIQSKPDGIGYNNGFADMQYATFNKCVLNGTLGLDFTCEFNECKFNVEGNAYNLWTWGAGTVTFNKCTFNCDGKALLVYANVLDNGTTHQTVNISDCIFNDNGDDTITGKAAIEVSNTYTPIRTYDVIINRTTVNGFTQTVPGSGDFNAAYGSVDGANIGTNVWGNKCQLAADYLNVVIDGVDVY